MPAESSQYLSIIFFGSHVVAALWQEVDQRISIIARSTLRELTDEETLPESVDLALEELGEDSLSVRQVLFVVPQVWTDQGQLINEKKAVLKELSEDLLLKPLGFVVLEDGLRSWQEQSTGQSFSGAIIQHLADSLQVKVYIEGESAASFQIGKSGQVKDDIVELQARLKRYQEECTRVLYFETSGEDNDYSQLVVHLHKQLGKPVEKMTALQVADIAISSGGLEMLGISVDSSASSPLETTQLSPTTDVVDQEAEFKPPSFVINQGSAAANPSIDTSDPDYLEESNVEPVLNSPPKKKSRKLALPSLPKFNFSSFRKSKKTLLLAIVPLALLFILAGGYLLVADAFTSKVVIEIDNQKLETLATLPLVIDGDPEIASQEALPAKKISETVTVSKEVPTTGTKLTGEPAKGKVVIFNKTSEPKTFSKGTNLHTGNKTFSLDEEVTVASAAAQENRGSRTVTYGEQEASVTAITFGPEGNIPEKQEFTVDDFGTSSYYALNDRPFEGGTSREIQSVAQKDVDNTVSELLDEATNTIKERLNALSTQKEPVLVTNEITKDDSQSSIAVGQEAKLITVSLTATGMAYQLDVEDLAELTDEIFADDLREGFQLQTDALTLSNPQLVSNGDSPILEVEIKTFAKPKTDIASMKNELLGQYTARAQSILEKFPGVKGVETQLQPSWAGLLFKRFPKESEKIMIEVKADNP